ncbi:unnamed protein product [Spirodela intermedia]|uniref:Uncharacterized protein n=1 Tax=Spirodela intermedia TaxID=51605 RepID=A0A7I8IJQ4_SPIIN|nr:unnamed protein product [Spirodela intermedia]CAA6657368.1 unnamed protein product [Spirodela intermedia]
MILSLVIGKTGLGGTEHKLPKTSLSLAAFPRIVWDPQENHKTIPSPPPPPPPRPSRLS